MRRVEGLGQWPSQDWGEAQTSGQAPVTRLSVNVPPSRTAPRHETVPAVCHTRVQRGRSWIKNMPRQTPFSSVKYIMLGSGTLAFWKVVVCERSLIFDFCALLLGDTQERKPPDCLFRKYAEWRSGGDGVLLEWLQKQAVCCCRKWYLKNRWVWRSCNWTSKSALESFTCLLGRMPFCSPCV